MAGSLLRIIPRKWLIQFTLFSLALAGLGLVFNYTYLSIVTVHPDQLTGKK